LEGTNSIARARVSTHDDGESVVVLQLLQAVDQLLQAFRQVDVFGAMHGDQEVMASRQL
jgi:hypothetical protein